jgi:hypothetical protein
MCKVYGDKARFRTGICWHSWGFEEGDWKEFIKKAPKEGRNSMRAIYVRADVYKLKDWLYYS